MSRCKGITRKGGPCGFPPVKGERLCRNHKNPEQAREAAARASEAARVARARPWMRMTGGAFSLHNRASIQSALDALVRLEIYGLIPEAKSRTLHKWFSLALRNFDRPKETLEGFAPQAHDAWEHHMRMVGFLASMEPALERATEREQAEMEAMARQLEGLE